VAETSRTRRVRLIPFVDKRVGVQIKRCDPLTMRAVPERFCSEVLSRRAAVSSVFYLYSEKTTVFTLSSSSSVRLSWQETAAR